MQSHINNNQSLQTPTFLPGQKIEDKLNYVNLKIRVEESQDRQASDHEGHDLVSRQVYQSDFQSSPFARPHLISPIQSKVFQDEVKQKKDQGQIGKCKEDNSSHGKIKCGIHKVEGFKEIMFICLQKDCKISKNKFENRIMCLQCINQQLHRKHLFTTMSKLDQICTVFHQAGLQTAKTVMLKIGELRHRFENFIEQFIYKVQEMLFIKTTPLKPNSARNKSEREPLSFVGSQKIEKLISQEILQELLTQNATASMTSILKFQQEAISQQIENIYTNFEESIKDGMANIEFIHQYKNLLFNPDDMHADEVGLTLDRNKLEAIALATHGEIDRSNNLSKFAFTQTPLFTENSRSFRINGLKEKIMIGCVDSQAHQIISSELSYESCQHLLMGILINSKGQITLYNRGQAPKQVPGIEIRQNDIIELTLHQKQSTLVIIRYSALDGLQRETELENQLDGKNASLMGNLNRHVIATLSIESVDQPVCYPLAGVTVEGDSISLVENIVFHSVEVDNQARKVDDSYEEQESLHSQNKKGISKLAAFKEKQKSSKKNS